MDPQQIKAFIDAMSASDLDEMEVSHEGWTLRLVRRTHPGRGAIDSAQAPILARTTSSEAVTPNTPPTGSAPQEQAPREIAPFEVMAPMFGVVHLQQAPGEAPYVLAGDEIQAGQLLCTIEAMKVFNEVRADHAGRVATVLVTSGAEVEAGQVLLHIERTGDV